MAHLCKKHESLGKNTISAFSPPQKPLNNFLGEMCFFEAAE